MSIKEIVHLFILEKSRFVLLDVNLTAKRLGITPEEVQSSLEMLDREKTINAYKVKDSVYSIRV